MEYVKKIGAILLFATAPFYEACVTKFIINNPDLSERVEGVITNVEHHTSPVYLRKDKQVEKPLKKKRRKPKKKVIKKRRKPKKKAIRKKKRRKPKKKVIKNQRKARRKSRGNLRRMTLLPIKKKDKK